MQFATKKLRFQLSWPADANRASNASNSVRISEIWFNSQKKVICMVATFATGKL